MSLADGNAEPISAHDGFYGNPLYRYKYHFYFIFKGSIRKQTLEKLGTIQKLFKKRQNCVSSLGFAEVFELNPISEGFILGE